MAHMILIYNTLGLVFIFVLTQSAESLPVGGMHMMNNMLAHAVVGRRLYYIDIQLIGLQFHRTDSFKLYELQPTHCVFSLMF